MPLRTNHWLWYCSASIAAAAIGTALWHFPKGRPFNEPYNPPPMSFDGTSDHLQQTVLVPTLDSPIPEGKSAIWCVSFQLAWKRLKEDVAKEPIKLTNAQPVADRLNTAASSEDGVPPDAVYADAGLAKDGIEERIRAQMASKFPKAPSPQLDFPPGGAVTYAYLEASAKYSYPFFENDERYVFTDSAGKQTAVRSFGIRSKDDYAYRQLRQQVEILYCPREAIWSEKEIPEFILDPCKNSQPYQIVLARVNRKPTLADTLGDVEQKIAEQPARDRFLSELHPRDTLLVPNIAWRISHRFRELEGTDKQFLNTALRGLYLDTALQTIRFRLDSSGAELASESKVFVKPGASFFHVNRPFLVYLKNRGGKHPFFVMWVENAELLEKE
jgi:hypothetical protein